MPFAWFDFYAKWEDNINRTKKILNYFREKMGLPELTDRDFRAIEANNQGEKPKNPGNNEPNKIKGSKFDDYNYLYSLGNHEVIRKYNKLYQEVIGQTFTPNGNGTSEWNQAGYDNLAKLSSFTEAYGKIKQIYGSASAFIPHDASAELEKEYKEMNEKTINAMKEAIKWMEKLLAEQKGNGVDKVQVNSVSEPGSKKQKAETESIQDNIKKSRTIASELGKLIRDASGLNTYAELEAKIKKIDEYQGEAEYNSWQKVINQLKIKLGKLDGGKFKQGVIQKIKDEMKNSGVEESDLDAEIKKDLAEMRPESDINKINELGSKISEKIGQREALNSLSKFLEEARKLINGTVKGTVEELRKQVEKIKKDLYSFQSSTNSWKNTAYQGKENDVKAMLTELENYSAQNNTTQKPKSGFFRPAVIIPVGLVAVLGIVAAVVVVRKRKPVKAK